MKSIGGHQVRSFHLIKATEASKVREGEVRDLFLNWVSP